MFAGTRDGHGQRVANDQFNEFLNLALCKIMTERHFTPELFLSRSKSLFFMHAMQVAYMKELYNVSSKKGKDVDRSKEFEKILAAMEKEELFELQEGRSGFSGFKTLSENIHIDKKSKDVFNWTAEHIKKFRKHGHLHTDHKLNVSAEALEEEERLDNEYVSMRLRSGNVIRNA